MTDRVDYSFGMKLPGFEGQFSSVEFRVTLSSDVKAKESADEAFNRVREFVESESEKEYDRIIRIRSQVKEGPEEEESKDDESDDSEEDFGHF